MSVKLDTHTDNQLQNVDKR